MWAPRVWTRRPASASGPAMLVSIRDRVHRSPQGRGVMPTEADVAVVQRFYTALAAGDLAAAGKCFREDAVWHLPGTRPLPRDRDQHVVGRQALQAAKPSVSKVRRSSRWRFS